MLLFFWISTDDSAMDAHRVIDDHVATACRSPAPPLYKCRVSYINRQTVDPTLDGKVSQLSESVRGVLLKYRDCSTRPRHIDATRSGIDLHRIHPAAIEK